MHSFLLKRVSHVHPCLVLWWRFLSWLHRVFRIFSIKENKVICLFLGKPPQKLFLAGPFSLNFYDLPQHVGWWSYCLTSLFFKIPVLHSKPSGALRDGRAHLRPEECLDVILLPLAVWVSYFFSLINREFKTIVRRQFTWTIIALMEWMIKYWLLVPRAHTWPIFNFTFPISKVGSTKVFCID